MMNTNSIRSKFPMLLALGLGLILLSWQAVPVQIEGSRPERAVSGDKEPEFPGGTKALIEFFNKNLRYPEGARKAGAEGTVYVEFLVKADGGISNVVVKRGVRADIDAEAMRVLGKMPAWTPGTKDGRPVDAQMVLPIRFELPRER